MRGNGGRPFGPGFVFREKTCLICHEAYTPTSVRQKWCRSCAPSPADRDIIRKYGITKADYDIIWRRQEGLCGVCLCPLATLPSSQVCIDHCHYTGNVRGIVCLTCNVRLVVLDNAVWRERAEIYLARPAIPPRCDCSNLRNARCKEPAPSTTSPSPPSCRASFG